MSQATDTPTKPTFEAFGQTFTVNRTPPTFLLAALARTGSGDPEAVGVLYEFFEVVLDGDEFRRFRKAAYADTDDTGEALTVALSAAIEAALPATPTR